MKERVPAGILILALLFAVLFPLGSVADENAVYCYGNDREHRVFSFGSGKEKCIALTFDDGPHPKQTEKILKILEKYRIKATFFVIGQNAEYYPETLKKVIEAGHDIGSHTYSHRHISALCEKELATELQKNRAVLQSFGVTPTLFRPPEGVCNDFVYSACRKENCDIILWTVDTEDWASPETEVIVRRILDHVKGGDIILMHDYVCGADHTAKALEIVIPELLKRGYTFVTVKELLAHENSIGNNGKALSERK